MSDVLKFAAKPQYSGVDADYITAECAILSVYFVTTSSSIG